MTVAEPLDAAEFPSPESDPFYSHIDAAGRPGDLRNIREVDLGDEFNAWQVRYQSSGATGLPIVPSGTVLIPRAPCPGPRPIIGYAVGVRGLGRNCAPSYLLHQGKEPEARLIRKALRRGWAVAIADGEGLGTDGPHTFFAGRPAGHTLLDIARAAADLPEATLSRGAPVGLWGYSAGGRAVTWAAELQPSYAPELDLRVAAAGGVPADPNVMIPVNMTGPFQGLAFAALVGLSAAYHHLPLRDILTDSGRRAADQAQHEDLAGLLANYARPLDTYSHRSDPWNSPEWRPVLHAERNGTRCPAVPIHLYHGRDDVLAPISMGRRLAEDYRALGGSATWTELATDHFGGVGTGADLALNTLTEHLG